MREFDALVKRLNFNRENEQWNAARLLSAVYDAAGNTKKSGGKLTPYDFMPEGFSTLQKPENTSWQHQLKMAEWWNIALKGKDLRKK